MGVTRQNNQAYKAFKAGDWATAGVRLEQLARDNPGHKLEAAWWFDAALSYKFLRDWPRAYELGLEAARRVERGRQEPAYWNLGIAATILGEWGTARDAWDGFGVGVPMPEGDGPIELRLGITPVRLSNDEVVWTERLCPTRARVLSVPLMDSGRRYGEIVVHDGVPNGNRVVDGETFSVFDELVLLEPSDLATTEVTVEAGTPADVRALVESFEQAGYGAEPESSYGFLCACCSTGSVEQDREHHEAGRQTVFLAAPDGDREALLERWRVDAPGQRSWR